MQLSKSEYIMFLKHPAWAWLKKHDKDKLPEPDANLQAIFEAGIEFESYANQRFPNGVEIGFKDFSEYGSMPARTRKALQDGAKVLFQARFEADLSTAQPLNTARDKQSQNTHAEHSRSITCICDVVEVVSDPSVEKPIIDLYEVKSSTKVKPEHIPDLAFQMVVLEHAGIDVRNLYVIHVNNDYVREGEIDAKEITTIEDVTDDVREIEEQTKYNIQKALDTIHQDKMPDPSPRHLHLGSMNDWLDIYKNLHDIPPYSIYHLARPGTKRLAELEDLDIENIADIPEDFNLTTNQQAQVLATKKDEEILEPEKIKEFLDELTYPLYFLDYETAMSVVPLYDGTRPYQQIPFQYSLHIVQNPTDDPEKWEHTDYLHTEKDNPVPHLLEKLKKDIGTVGDVIVWYQGFEKKRNEEMAEMEPAYADFLADVNSRVIDLMVPFQKNWFVHKDFFGSASIKAVLPVLVPELSYKELAIQEGAAAQRTWMEAVLKDSYEGDTEKLFNDLREYCKLDTRAMVEIWRVLRNSIQ